MCIFVEVIRLYDEYRSIADGLHTNTADSREAYSLTQTLLSFGVKDLLPIP